MKKTRRTTEQIIRILRDAASSGKKTEEVSRANNISGPDVLSLEEQIRGLDLNVARRLRELEKENTELKKLLADQLLKSKALEIALERNI